MNNQIKIVRTDALNIDFKELIKELDAYLSIINGSNDAFFRGHNKIEALKNVVVLYKEEVPVACGAFKKITNDTAEVKRMYVRELYRRNNYATLLLGQLERWACESGISKLILETSITMYAAAKLYESHGYRKIENYEPYKGVASSVCFEKNIII